VPFIEKRDESFDIEFDFLGGGSATHCDMIMIPSFVVEFTSQDFQEFGEILTIGGIGDVSVVAVVDTVVGEIFPVDTDAIETGPLRE
jgi:hypothetical protein